MCTGSLFQPIIVNYPTLASLLLLTTLIPFVGFSVRGSGDVMCFPLTSHQVSSKVPCNENDSQLIPLRHYDSNSPTVDIIIPCALCQRPKYCITVSARRSPCRFKYRSTVTLSVTKQLALGSDWTFNSGLYLLIIELSS